VHAQLLIISFGRAFQKLQALPMPDTEAEFYPFYKDVFLTVSAFYVAPAVVCWSILMRHRCIFLDLWIAYLLSRFHVARDWNRDHMSKDVWDTFYLFCREFNKQKFEVYKFDGRLLISGANNFVDPWPTFIDGFIEFLNVHQSSQ
jgi:hypothetical protein